MCDREQMMIMQMYRIEQLWLVNSSWNTPLYQLIFSLAAWNQDAETSNFLSLTQIKISRLNFFLDVLKPSH